MERRLLQLGSTHLLQLGSLRLLELGSTQGGVAVSPVIDMFSFVNTIEDPYAGTGVTPPNEQARAVAERLRIIARNRRREIVGGVSLSGIDQLGTELAHLRGILMASAQNLRDLDDGYDLEECYDPQLGKNFFKKVARVFSPKTFIKVNKMIAHKTLKVVKSPAFLAVAGVIVNVIPGIGQVASGLLLAAAMTSIAAAGVAENAYRMKVEKGKAVKAQAAAQAAADAKTNQDLDKFYADYKDQYLIPLGYIPSVWASYTTAQKIVIANALSAGSLQPYVPTDAALAQFYSANKAKLNSLGYTDAVWGALGQTDKLQIAEAFSENNLRPYQTPQAAVDAVAMSQAMNQVYGTNGTLPNVPPDVKAAADAKTPAVVDQIQAVGPDNFLATSTKAVGQVGATGALFDGSGASMPDPQADVAKVVNSNANSAVKTAISHAKDDFLNTAAADGDPSVAAALSKANPPSDFPWIPIVVTVGLTASVIGGTLALSRGRR